VGFPVKTVAVVGAGVSGLAFANRLREISEKRGLPLEVRVFDRASRAGGSIATEMRDGFLLEGGPDAFVSEKPWVRDLARRIGIESQIIGTRENNRRTFVARRGKLHGLPGGFYLIAPSDIPAFMRTPIFSAKGKLRMLMETVIPASKVGEDESVASFIRRRFGREALERVGQPMIAGVYSGDPEELSILHTMPRFKELEAKYGSVIRGLQKSAEREGEVLWQTSGPRYSLFLSFARGMGTLIEALVNRIGLSSLSLGFGISSVRHEPSSGRWQLLSARGDRIEADEICFSTPAEVTAELLKETAPSLSKKLGQIRYESVATLNLAYHAGSVPHALDGFGFVMAASEGRSLMACTFVDRKFKGRAPEGKILLRAFVGGAFGRRFFEMEDNDLLRMVRRDLEDLLGIRDAPLFYSLERYPQALPQYHVGHGELLSEIETARASLNGISLTGSSYRGTGVPDCVHDAEEEAEKTIGRLFAL
jgi:oxygen-dependent protoporphyrinogen oxidase